MRLLFSLLTGSLLALPAAAQLQPTMNDLMATPLKVRGVDCALFPAIAQFDTTGLRRAKSPPYRFTPTHQQVEAAESQLNTEGIYAIRAPYTPYDSVNLAYIQKNLLAYRRQYFGFYNAQHQACLFIQLFEDDNTDWLYRHLLFLDGGSSVWEVCYNLDTRRFYSLGYHSQG